MKTQTQLLSRYIAILLLIFLTTFSIAQTPTIEWQKTYGGSGNEDGGIIKLQDGNYLEWGATSSSDGDFTFNHGDDDGFLMKLDANGNILWQKTYGGSSDEDFASVIELSNGSFVVLGTTSSNDGDVSGNHGDYDIWMVRVSANGNLQSQHCFGGSGDDESYDHCLVKLSDGSYLLAGLTNSNDGDVTGNHGDYDNWILKVNKWGNIAWSKCIGGNGYEYSTGLVQTANNKFVLVGGTTSNDGDVSGNHGGYYYGDAFVVKLNKSGNILWTKCFGGSGEELVNNVTVTADGNIALGTTSNSNDGDVSGNHGEYDMWIPKINISSGNIIWQTSIGTTDIEGALGIMSTSDGGVVSLGETSSDFDYVNWNAQATKLSADGTEQWTKIFGGSAGEYAFMGLEVDDSTLLIQCNTDSYDGDVINQHGPGDAWLVKMSTNGIWKMAGGNLDSGSVINAFPNPFSTSTTILFSLSQSENVSLKIFDLQGRLVRTIANENICEGEHTFSWDARDENGGELSAGIYFLNFLSENESKTIRLSLLK